jgi:hypothetical protein
MENPAFVYSLCGYRFSAFLTDRGPQGLNGFPGRPRVLSSCPILDVLSRRQRLRCLTATVADISLGWLRNLGFTPIYSRLGELNSRFLISECYRLEPILRGECGHRSISRP